VALSTLFPLVIVLAFALGATTRRLVVVLFAVAIWPLYFAGLLAGLWGSGVGDGWASVATMLAIASAAGALTGVIWPRAASS
jgi:hypothetical protein